VVHLARSGRPVYSSQRDDLLHAAMTPILCGLFFLSGAAALLFETLWFRQAGLAFGNSVWASSLVLSSFMAGLALGNGLMARHGGRIRHPVRLYAGFEAVIALAGVTLVLGLPQLGHWLAPVFRQLLEQPIALNGLRLGSAFVLLLLPATAMGATLPVLVKALLAHDANFGSVLGRLYGWNTLGAVAGAVAGEWFLIEWFGIRGTAVVAGGFDIAAAVVALGLSRRFHALVRALGGPGLCAHARRRAGRDRARRLPRRTLVAP